MWYISMLKDRLFSPGCYIHFFILRAEGAIVGGNPAKVIGWTEELAKRRIAENRKNYTIFNEVEEVEKYYWEILPHNNN